MIIMPKVQYIYCVLTRWLALLVVCWEANTDYTKDYAFHCASMHAYHFTKALLGENKGKAANGL